jgi:hypothetical protein
MFTTRQTLVLGGRRRGVEYSFPGLLSLFDSLEGKHVVDSRLETFLDMGTKTKREIISFTVEEVR